MRNRPSLTLKRRLKAPPAQVYSAWTDPKKIARWFGPREAEQASVTAELDLKVGGRYRISFTGEGGEQHQVGGVYRELVPGRRLVFSWAWHSTPERTSLVSITLDPDGSEGTLLTLQHEQFFDEKARDGHERGWTGTLEKLEQYLGQNPAKEASMPATATAAPRNQPPPRTPHGHFHWNELRTRDSERAKRFYAETIGWTFQPTSTPDGHTYWLALCDGKPVAGLFHLVSPKFDDVPESWIAFLAVDDVDARVEKAMRAGAKLMLPLFDVPDVGRIAMLMEPGGAGIGWITPAGSGAKEG